MDSLRFNEEDFNEYLEQLIKSGRLNLMQAGITKLVIDKGYDVCSKTNFSWMKHKPYPIICNREI